MEKSKVYFTDFRARTGEGLPAKLKRLMKKAGFASMDMEGKFVAIKMHFGELGNISYLRPNYAKAVADMVKEAGGIPFLTDCNTLYPGSRKNAIEHMYCAWENGFTPGYFESEAYAPEESKRDSKGRRLTQTSGKAGADHVPTRSRTHFAGTGYGSARL